MRALLVKVLILASAGGVLAACDNAKSPTEVAKDTTAAEQNSAEARERALRIAERREEYVAGRSNADARELAHETAVQQQKIANTEAEGERRIALAHCEAWAARRRSPVARRRMLAIRLRGARPPWRVRRSIRNSE